MEAQQLKKCLTQGHILLAILTVTWFISMMPKLQRELLDLLPSVLTL